MLNSLYMAAIAMLLAITVAQCEQKNDAKKLLVDAKAELTQSNINKTLCESTRDSQNDTIQKLQSESDSRKRAASSAMAEAKAEQGRQAAIIENIRRAPRTGESCESIRLKMLEDSKL